MLRSRQKFENMAARVAKVKPPPAFARVELPTLKAPGFAYGTESGPPAHVEESYQTH